MSVLRPVLGAMVALAAYVFLKAEIVQVGTITPLKALAISFVAGFSDQLVTRAAESVAGGSASGDRRPPGKETGGSGSGR